MMRWGRDKPSAASSSHPHLISHVFPLSWLSKFKRPTEKSAFGFPKTSQKGKQNVPMVSPKSPMHYSDNRNNRFYTQDDEGFWKVSFGEKGDNNNSRFVGQQRYCGNCQTHVKEAANKKRRQKSDKKHGAEKPRVVSSRAGISTRNGILSKEAAKDESLHRTYRRIIEATSELQRELKEVKDGYRRSLEKEMSEQDLSQVMQMMARAKQRPSCPDSGEEWRAALTETEIDRFFQQKHEHELLQALKLEDARLERQQMKDTKINELRSRGKKQRKSFHIGKDFAMSGSTQGKVKIRSPRTPSKTETCKIKALENLRKAKMKKKMKEMAMEAKAAELESFAVVKCSHNPQQDFRESMIEMIIEKRIRRPEELEELLACYLTLNAGEYHGIIIKVFKQVWCELEEADFNHQSPNKHHCDG